MGLLAKKSDPQLNSKEGLEFIKVNFPNPILVLNSPFSKPEVSVNKTSFKKRF